MFKDTELDSYKKNFYLSTCKNDKKAFLSFVCIHGVQCKTDRQNGFDPYQLLSTAYLVVQMFIRLVR